MLRNVPESPAITIALLSPSALAAFARAPAEIAKGALKAIIRR